MKVLPIIVRKRICRSSSPILIRMEANQKKEKFSPEIAELLHLYQSSENRKEIRRYHALLLMKLGKSKAELSEMFFVSVDALRDWEQKWDGNKHVRDKERTGRPPTLTKEEEEALCKIVDQNKPSDEGFSTTTWDCAELSTLALQKWNKKIGPEAIRQILKKHEFNYVKAEYLFTKRDEQARRDFVQEVLALYEAKTEHTKVMFGDEMSAKLHPKPGYVWTRNGTPKIPTNCSHKRINTIGAVDPLAGDKVVGTYEKNNADSFVQFLEKVARETKENVILWLDNYRVHHSKKVQDFLSKCTKITLKFLPTYSPDLNVIEWLWGYLRKKYLNCFVPKSKEELQAKIEESLNKIPPDRIRAICNLKILEKHRLI